MSAPGKPMTQAEALAECHASLIRAGAMLAQACPEGLPRRQATLIFDATRSVRRFLNANGDRACESVYQ